MKMKKIGLAALAAVMVASVASCQPKEGVGKYTYNYAMSVFPNNWNPHTYQTNTDAEIQGYTTDGFYTFDYNDTKDGYEIVPAMAKGMPEDVSAQYVGEKWGIAEGETGRAWKIDLRDDLMWEDGTAIGAQDFVTSAQLLLNPVAQNYRADTLYQGNFVVTNARNYYYQSSHAYPSPIVSEAFGDDEYIPMSDFTVGENNVILTPAGSDVALKISSGGNWSSNSLQDYANAGHFKEGAPLAAVAAQWDRLVAAANEADTVVLTTSLVKDLQDVIACLHGHNDVESYAASAGDYAYIEWQEMAYLGYDYPEMSFEDVGLKVVDGDLVIILEKELSGFYLLYNLTGSWLVHEETYKNCETIDENGIYQNNYGTSVETFKSYGPYTLTSFQMDKEFSFTKNEKWYGHKEESDVPLYQTTDIVVTFVPEPATRLQMFEKGELDSYGLTSDDMADYSKSEYLYYTEGASTFFMALNPDANNLAAQQEAAGENKNKTILTELDFRKALSFAVDRVAFCLACDPTGIPGKAVFNNLIISDPENGIAYRTNEEAKDVLLAFWGLTDEIGEGKRYATKDDAIASITGVDLAQAKELFTSAYNKALANGLLDEDDVVELKIGTPNSTTAFYKKGYDYLVNCWTDAVTGTPLEGKLTFTKDDTLGNGFADALRDNKVDILFGVGWTGSALDPFGLVEAYTKPSYQYDDSIDYTKINKDVYFEEMTDANGVKHTNITLRASVAAWSIDCLAGNAINAYVVVDGVATDEIVSVSAGTKADLAFRTKILAACEAAILEQYTMLPLNDDASAALKSMKINYYTEQYVYGVGRGGVKYMTYNYDDAQWKAFVDSNNGQLQYK